MIYAFFAVSAVSSSQPKPQPKFRGSATFTLPKACGNGLDDQSSVGTCVYVAGAAVTKYATSGHVCVQLPAGKKDTDMVLTPSAANSVNGPFLPCDNQGFCRIGWAKFESGEYYADKNTLCGRFKNWSNTTDRTFTIIVDEK
jgi:hypothetical protein